MSAKDAAWLLKFMAKQRRKQICKEGWAGNYMPQPVKPASLVHVYPLNLIRGGKRDD